MKLNAEDVCSKNNITDEDLKQICKRYLVKEGYDFRKFWINALEFEDFSGKTCGFLGYHLKLTITVSPKSVFFADDPQSDDEDDERSLTFFVKLLPTSMGQLNYVEEMRIFEKETELYQFLIPRLQDIAIGAKEWAAQSYLSKDDKVLILEDLRLDGFQMLSCKLGQFDLDHLLVASAVIGRFHASSMILENRTRESILQLYPNVLNEAAYPDDGKESARINNAIAALLGLILHIPKYQSDIRALEVIQRELPTLMKKMIEFVKCSRKYRNVFCHGDLWANNFLFLYESVPDNDDSSGNESNTEFCLEEVVDVEINHETESSAEIACVLKDLDGQLMAAKNVMRANKISQPVDARLVDFQLSRYAPPATDLMTFLHMTTSKDVREKHTKLICENYYDSLRVELDRVGLDVNYELPKEQFWETVHYYSCAGLIEACYFSHITLVPEEVIEKVFANSEEFGLFMGSPEKRSEVCTNVFQSDKKYRERMTELLVELIDSHILEVTAL